MADYDLYYWPVPFRGQFIRAILAYAGKSWDEHDAGEIEKLMTAAPRDQPVPFMGPPVLIDNRTGLALSEMPAIAVYLGETLGLIPDDAASRAMTAKIVNDANDVIDEITIDGGREMWTAESWDAFVLRLKRWMAFWETTGVQHGLKDDDGFLLGTEKAGVADIVTSTLWSTMSGRFSSIAAMLDEAAPRAAALSRRLQEVPSLKALKEDSDARYGETYCGGEIEISLRKVTAKAG
ncbi:glutathione S-transferase (plasmid) [Sphingomonas paeninsulae]|uniref:Glutathione S-transferase n=1 Tax=Sphingomonas paeninsulae TaxID=2319844 RepID=A0A494T6E9_SPHPE|nr:glutathione S-transferase [Sphingomonas paeninsulae]AYJ84979.1 glutathione S-transferase [Sphingomonas paeninsulae]